MFQYNFWGKAVYLAYMTRLVLLGTFDKSILSDKVLRGRGDSFVGLLWKQENRDLWRPHWHSVRGPVQDLQPEGS